LRTNVACEAASGVIAGFVSLSAGQIERAYLPKSEQRNRPDAIPAVLVGQLAVDLRFQRRGLARSLLYFALSTAVRMADEVGCFGVILHPLDDDLRAFYARFGFETLPFDPRRAMVARIIDVRRSSLSSQVAPGGRGYGLGSATPVHGR
jgi:GNAT superfamily N-acetyltransferase